METLPGNPSTVLSFGFILLSAVMVITWLCFLKMSRAFETSRASIIFGLWAIAFPALSYILSTLPFFHDFSRFPPVPLPYFIFGLVCTVMVAFTPGGSAIAKNLPLWLLVGFQSFRIPVELLINLASEQGVAPVQMTYHGRNFDIISAILGLVLGAILLARRDKPTPKVMVLIFNLVGLALLANVVIVGILSFPSPFRVFMNEPSNIWITFAPFSLLPCCLVATALMGHVLVFRRLGHESRSSST